mgnify:CR=1 FL=1
MKKRLLSICLIVILVLSLGSAAMAASKPENSFIPGRVPAETDAIQSVTPPIHALVLCMVENDLEYSKSDLFTWKSLYYMLSLYGQMDARAELTDDMLILPAETAADYASALFPDFQGLPPLPAGWDRVIYDARLTSTVWPAATRAWQRRCLPEAGTSAAAACWWMAVCWTPAPVIRWFASRLP